MKRDLFWSGLLTRIAQRGALSYIELKGLPIEEFFLLVMEYEKSNEDGRGFTKHKSPNSPIK